MNQSKDDNTSPFRIQVIDTYVQFKELKTDWEAIYLNDPTASFYFSWLWFSGWLKVAPNPWFILAVLDESRSNYVAFLPLELRPSQIKKMQPVRLLRTAGEPVLAMNGILYKPEHENEILKIIAHYIQDSIGWDKLQFRNMPVHQAQLFADNFSNKKFKVNLFEGLPTSAISLPATWEVYEKNMLGSQSRKTLKRLSNKINANTNITMTEVSGKTVDQDIDIVLNFWQSRYGTKHYASLEKQMFRHFFDHGRLWLNIFWDGFKPISAQACILDTEKETCIAYMTGYDTAYSNLSPGNVIGLVSTKLAIEKGFKNYNFLIGHDKYKLSLGAELQNKSNIYITRKSLRTHLALILNSILARIKEPLKKIIG